MQNRDPGRGIPSAKENIKYTRAQLTSGQIISESFRAFSMNMVAFLAIAAICIIPAFAMQLFGLLQEDENFRIAGQVLVMLMTIPAQAAMVYGTVQYMAGRTTNIGDNIQRGFDSMLSVILVGIAVMLVVVAGFLMFIIPGFIFLMVFYVAMPVAVVERVGVSESMARSADLTRGVRWTIFGAVFVVLILQLGISLGAEEVATAILGLHEKSWQVATITTLIEMFFGALSAVMTAVVYVRLRHNNDDIDAQELSNVFA